MPPSIVLCRACWRSTRLPDVTSMPKSFSPHRPGAAGWGGARGGGAAVNHGGRGGAPCAGAVRAGAEQRRLLSCARARHQAHGVDPRIVPQQERPPPRACRRRLPGLPRPHGPHGPVRRRCGVSTHHRARLELFAAGCVPETARMPVLGRRDERSSSAVGDGAEGHGIAPGVRVCCGKVH